MSDDKKYKIHTCYHCGNQGLMKIEHTYSHKYGGGIYDPFGDLVAYEIEEYFDWILLSCPVCNKATLRLDYQHEYSNDDDPSVETLYPQSKIDYVGVPANIKSAFESALKVKNIDTSVCSIALRRVLEAICKDKGAEGRNLELMVKDMISRGILPEMFNDACWIVRHLGNSAAHGDNKQFSIHQIDQTIMFMQSIINYLYTLPVKMQLMRKAIDDSSNEYANPFGEEFL